MQLKETPLAVHKCMKYMCNCIICMVLLYEWVYLSVFVQL